MTGLPRITDPQGLGPDATTRRHARDPSAYLPIGVSECFAEPLRTRAEKFRSNLSLLAADVDEAK
jgi:hypothetical protein